MATDTRSTRSRASTEQIPPLENGDNLSREEFERRYSAMPHVKKAELIEGIVYMPSPVSVPSHGKPHGVMMNWLGHYYAFTPGVDFCDNGSVCLDPDNMLQPDGFLFVLPSHGGATRISEEGYIEGAPELVAEVASTSASKDLNQKLQAYQRNGIPEYVVFRTRQKKVDWFLFREGKYVSLAPSADGLLRSEVFPGLWLDPEALLNGDLARVFAVLQQGLASPEHAAFVEKLRQKAAEIAGTQP